MREDVRPDVHVTSNVELRNNVRLLLNVDLLNYVRLLFKYCGIIGLLLNNNACTCRLCGQRQPTKSHLLSCRTSILASHIVITPVNVNKVVNVLYGT